MVVKIDCNFSFEHNLSALKQTVNYSLRQYTKDEFTKSVSMEGLIRCY